jgi:hypothetical protein
VVVKECTIQEKGNRQKALAGRTMNSVGASSLSATAGTSLMACNHPRDLVHLFMLTRGVLEGSTIKCTGQTG